MSTPVTNHVPIVNTAPGSVSTLPTTVTLSADPSQSTLSSATQEVKGPLHCIFKTLSYPFVSIGKFFANGYRNTIAFLASCFRSASANSDRKTIAFIKNNLSALSGDVLQEALDKVSHLSKPKEKLHAFGLVQADMQISANDARAFYDRLPVDMQHHLQWHIWDENQRNDEGLGLGYGSHIIDTDIKSDLVLRALNRYLTE